MTHPNPGQPYPGAQQPYPGQPHPGQPYPGQPYPGQPHPGQPFPGAQQPFPGQPYLGAPYPGQPRPPRPPSKAMPVVAGLLYLPGVLLALVGAIGLRSRSGFAIDIWGAILMPPFPRRYGNFEIMSIVSFVLPGLALILAVLLMARVPGVRWGLVAISVLAAVHFGLVLASFSSALPPFVGFMPVIALLLWLVAGLIAALPPVGRAMRGAKPKTPPGPPSGDPPMPGAPGQPPGVPGPPPPGIPGPPPPGVAGPPPPQGQWG